MRGWLWLAFLLLLSCGTDETEEPPVSESAPLRERLALYQTLSEAVRDAHGFVEWAECDSLLFTALSSFAKPIDIWAAHEPSSGKWLRSPSKDCYPDRSKSEISRDMLLGLMWYAYMHRDLEIADSIWSYGLAHDWTMGEGVISRTKMSYGLRATLAQLVYKLGGTDHQDRLYPTAWLPGARDFEAHIQVWHILLRQRLYDQLEESAAARLADHVERQPGNPLFQYGVRNVAEAERLLLSLYPADRLPTSADYCEPWTIQRDADSKGWRPCDEGRVHSGGETLSIAYLLTEGR